MQQHSANMLQCSHRNKHTFVYRNTKNKWEECSKNFEIIENKIDIMLLLKYIPLTFLHYSTRTNSITFLFITCLSSKVYHEKCLLNNQLSYLLLIWQNKIEKIVCFSFADHIRFLKHFVIK